MKRSVCCAVQFPVPFESKDLPAYLTFARRPRVRTHQHDQFIGIVRATVVELRAANQILQDEHTLLAALLPKDRRHFTSNDSFVCLLNGKIRRVQD